MTKTILRKNNIFQGIFLILKFLGSEVPNSHILISFFRKFYSGVLEFSSDFVKFSLSFGKTHHKFINLSLNTITLLLHINILQSKQHSLAFSIMSAFITLALVVLLGFISVMVSSKRHSKAQMCMTTDVCSTKIASAAKYAFLNFDGAAGLNGANNFPGYGSGITSKIDLMSACLTADPSNPNEVSYDMTIQMHRLSSDLTQEAFCKVVKVRVSEALKGGPSGGFSNNFNNEGPSRAFNKVALSKDSDPMILANLFKTLVKLSTCQIQRDSHFFYIKEMNARKKGKGHKF